MEVTINIDAGGTFTDGFFSLGDRTETAKVPTTAHDLTVCFLDCIERGAEKLGWDPGELLERAEMVRFSTTVGTNTVLEKTGPKLGVLVTAGHASDCYAGNAKTVTDGLVPPALVRGIDEATTFEGEVRAEPDPDEVAAAVKGLQEAGARHIVIALANAHANPANERRVKAIIEAEYPRHYLGALPTTASFELTARLDDARRLNTAVINAYIHRPMKSALYKAEDRIRADGHDRPLFVGHSNAGVARVAKSIAINTHNSGPAAGVVGARALAELYDTDLVAADMGGTSIDISVVRDGQATVDLTPTIDGLETAIPAIDSPTSGAGGGSIANVDEGLSVGPESAGANPGPACFGRGGEAATVTDADVVRGVINPDYFLGGRYPLAPDRAVAAIDDDVAAPLGIDPAMAAHRVAERVQANIADGIREVAPDVKTIVAFGGAGGVHVAGFADALDVDRVVLTPYSSVFSAFGESLMDVRHTYAEFVGDPSAEAIEAQLDELLREARRDLRAEGFAREEIAIEVDLLIPDGAGYRVEAFEYAPDAGDLELPGGRDGSCVRLHASGPAPKPAFEPAELDGEDPSDAREDTRSVFWGDGYLETPTYRHGALDPNNVVGGPAVVEAVDTTIAVPPGRRYRIDRYGHGILERA